MVGFAFVSAITCLTAGNERCMMHDSLPVLLSRRSSRHSIVSWSLMSENPNHFIQEKELKRLRKAENRMNHITNLLLRKNRLGSADQKALNNLLARDTYDPSIFTESHRKFKQDHNHVFVSLALHCSSGGLNRPVFYLDGCNGGTTSCLRAAGWPDADLYIANLFPDTAKVLRDSYGIQNIFLGRAEDLLTSPALKQMQFVAYYLDGCGGSSAPLIAMVEAIFCDARMSQPRDTPPAPFAVGITLTESDSIGGRSLADREQEVTRRIAQLAREWGLRIDYAGDDPGRFGLSESPQKRDGITQTTWLVVSLSP